MEESLTDKKAADMELTSKECSIALEKLTTATLLKCTERSEILPNITSSSSNRSFFRRFCSNCDLPVPFKKREKKTAGKHCQKCGTILSYQCLNCTVKYKRYATLLYHIRSKCAPVVRYSCADCDYKAAFKHDLRKHILGQHLKLAHPIKKHQSCSKGGHSLESPKRMSVTLDRWTEWRISNTLPVTAAFGSGTREESAVTVVRSSPDSRTPVEHQNYINQEELSIETVITEDGKSLTSTPPAQTQLPPEGSAIIHSIVECSPVAESKISVSRVKADASTTQPPESNTEPSISRTSNNVISIENINFYINHNCSCGPCFYPTKVILMPTQFSGQIESVMQRIFQAFIMASRNIPETLNLIKRGEGESICLMTETGLTIVQLPVFMEEQDVYLFIRKQLKDFGACEHMISKIKESCRKCLFVQKDYVNNEVLSIATSLKRKRCPENQETQSTASYLQAQTLTEAPKDQTVPVSVTVISSSNSNSTSVDEASVGGPPTKKPRKSDPQLEACTSSPRNINPIQVQSVEPSEWTIEDVIRYITMADPSFKIYANLFRQDDIDGKALLLLNPEKMVKHMNFELESAQFICNLVKSITENQS